MARQPARDSSGTNVADEEEQTTEEADGAPADINKSRRSTDNTTQDSGDAQTTSQPSAGTSAPADVNDGRRTTTTEGPAQDPSTGGQSPPASEPQQSQQGIESPQGQASELDSRSDVMQAADETAAARELESRVIDETPGVDEQSDVRVERDGDQLQASLTESGQSDVLASRRQRAERSRDPRTGETAAAIESFETGVRREFADENRGVGADDVTVTGTEQGDPNIALTPEAQDAVTERARDPQTGRTAAAIESYETGVRRQFAADNPGVEASDVTVTGTVQGQPGIALNEDAEAAVRGLTPASPQGGRRGIQETSLEQRAAASGGDALSPGEVDATVTDDGVSIQTFEAAPRVADRAGGQRQIQAGSLREGTASRTPGVDAREVDANLTDEGASPELTETAKESRVESQLIEESDEIQAGDIRADVSDQGTVDVEYTEQGERRQLREKAEAKYPNAKDINIVEDDGELVAKIEKENDVEAIQRLSGNFIDDPLGSTVEGTDDIVTGIATDTEEFVSGTVEGIENPGETYDWAVSGTKENTIDPVASGINSFSADPAGSVEGATRDTAGVIVDLAEGGANASSGVVQGSINAGTAAYGDISSRASSGAAAAAVPVALGEPTPVGEGVLLTGAALGTTAAGTYYAGREAGRAYDQGFETEVTADSAASQFNNEDVSEIPAPSQRQDFQQEEIEVTEDTTVTQSEIDVTEDTDFARSEVQAPQSTTLGQSELDTPDTTPDTGTDVSDGDVGISLSPQQTVGGLDEPETKEEALEQIEEVLEDPEEFSRRERRELARQAYEQQIFEQQREYGELQRERVPEFRDEELSSGQSAEDIGSGIAGDAQRSKVRDDELIGGSTEGIQRDDTLPVEENFNRFMEEQRERLKQAERRGVRSARREDGEEEDLEINQVTSPSVSSGGQSVRANAQSAVGLTTPLLFVTSEEDEGVADDIAQEPASDTVPLERSQEDSAAVNVGELDAEQTAVSTNSIPDTVEDTQQTELTEETQREVNEIIEPEKVTEPSLTGNPNMTNNPNLTRNPNRIGNPTTPSSPPRTPGIPLLPDLSSDNDQNAQTTRNEDDLRYIYTLGEPLSLDVGNGENDSNDVNIPGFEEE